MVGECDWTIINYCLNLFMSVCISGILIRVQWRTFLIDSFTMLSIHSYMLPQCSDLAGMFLICTLFWTRWCWTFWSSITLNNFLISSSPLRMFWHYQQRFFIDSIVMPECEKELIGWQVINNFQIRITSGTTGEKADITCFLNPATNLGYQMASKINSHHGEWCNLVKVKVRR